MDPLKSLVPSAPGWSLDWQAISDALPEIAALDGCPQDPTHHGEGDVWVHTRMVCEALIADPAWRAVPDADRSVLFWTAVLHDIGKPATTRHEDGRITSRGHSRRGAQMARELLWRLGADRHERERICALIVHHLVPFFLLERDDPTRLAARISLTTRCDWLALQARADANGRIAPDIPRLLENVELYRAFCEDLGCRDTPFAFASGHSRFQYFRHFDRDPTYHAYDDTRLTATLMAGLPASGKDTWIERNLPDQPVVSLDRIRSELGIAPDKAQGKVIQAAREQARVHLREGRDFVWNATNLSRQIRKSCIDLFADYNARVRIVHMEAPPEVLRQRNRERSAPVPDKAVQRMIERWEVPDLTEAHEVELVFSS